MQTLSTYENQSVWTQPRQKLDGISMMDHLYNRLDGIYPNKFTANFRDISAISNWKDAWAEAFDDEGVTPQDVALGLKNCMRMFDWPPSLPEFLKACRPHLEPDVAFYEANRGIQARAKGEDGTWSHPAIFHAAMMVGQFEMMNQSYQQLANRWKKALAEQLALGKWEPIPEVLPQIESSVTTPQDAANARKVREQVAGAVSNNKNHLDWVEKILNNPEDRSHIAVQYAKKVAKERNLPIWQKFKQEEKNEEVTA